MIISPKAYDKINECDTMGFRDKFKNMLKSDETEKSGEDKKVNSIDDSDNIALNHLNNLMKDCDDIVIEDNTIRYVGDANSDSNAGSDFSIGFRYVKKLIHSGEKTIVLDKDIELEFDEESNFINGIPVDVDGITIDGAGHTIDAKSKVRIFDVTADNVTIKNIILKNAHAQSGAGIYNSGSLKLDNGVLINNRADTGAALYNAGDLDMENCYLSENASEKNGSISNHGNARINDCEFVHNAAKFGGAISHDVSTDLYVTNSKFFNNISSVGGAAIIVAQKSRLHAEECIFQENLSLTVGGAVDTMGTVNLKRTHFRANKAVKGAALFVFEVGDIDVHQCNFEANTAEGPGGAIYITDGATGNIELALFKDNVAKQEGGAIVGYNPQDINLVRCKFENNQPSDFN